MMRDFNVKTNKQIHEEKIINQKKKKPNWNDRINFTVNYLLKKQNLL